MENMKIAACGNVCSLCPRYVSKITEDLKKTAELWFTCGWRDNVVSDYEIACKGCSVDNPCRHNIARCVNKKHLNDCSECNEYPCENINAAFKQTEKCAAKIKELTDEKTYNVLKKSFFEKKQIIEDKRKKK